MRIEGTNPETGENYEAEAGNIDSDFIQSLLDFDLSEESIKRLIDNLDISADAKAIIFKITQVTIQVGEYIINIGRKIVDFVCSIYKNFPTTTFGVILGATLGLLVSSIPVIGALLGTLFTLLTAALGIIGFGIDIYNQITDKSLKSKIDQVVASYAPLNT